MPILTKPKLDSQPEHTKNAYLPDWIFTVGDGNVGFISVSLTCGLEDIVGIIYLLNTFSVLPFEI
jgi:hypothetical protein